MVFKLIASLFVLLCCLIAALFILRRKDKADTLSVCKLIGKKFRDQETEFEREIASVREEIRQLKVQRDDLEREERKVLDGMNNIMNYGFDVARKAARDGGEC